MCLLCIYHCRGEFSIPKNIRMEIFGKKYGEELISLRIDHVKLILWLRCLNNRKCDSRCFKIKIH